MQHQSKRKTKRTSFKANSTIIQTTMMKTVTQMTTVIIITHTNNKNHQHSIHLLSHPTITTTHNLLISSHRRTHSIILSRMRKMKVATTSLNQAIIIRTTNKRRDWRSLKMMMKMKKIRASDL